jgi:hypothetical protein
MNKTVLCATEVIIERKNWSVFADICCSTRQVQIGGRIGAHICHGTGEGKLCTYVLFTSAVDPIYIPRKSVWEVNTISIKSIQFCFPNT